MNFKNQTRLQATKQLSTTTLGLYHLPTSFCAAFPTPNMSSLDISHRGHVDIVFVYIFTVICTFLTVLRYIVARVTHRRTFADDYLVAFAFVNCYWTSGCINPF